MLQSELNKLEMYSYNSAGNFLLLRLPGRYEQRFIVATHDSRPSHGSAGIVVTTKVWATGICAWRCGPSCKTTRL